MVGKPQGEEGNFVLVLLGGGPERAQDKDDMTHYGFGVASRADIDEIAERARKDGICIGSRATMRRQPAISAG